MKSAIHKRWWFITGCALISIIGFRHVWMWLPEHRYAGMIGHDNFIAALQDKEPATFKKLALSYGYEYQIFKNGTLQESSKSGLPYLQLVSQPASVAGVLATSLKEQLTGSRPYEFTHGVHRYIYFGTTAGAYTYMVYEKVL